jgi:hypothetical protein
MTARPYLIVAVVVFSLFLAAVRARSARQVVAFFPLENLADNTVGVDLARFGQLIKDKLQDRLDVQMIGETRGTDIDSRKKKARSVGATYILTGSVSRIGRTVSLDLNLAAADEPSKGRTVVVTGVDENPRKGQAMPPVFSRMATEAAARLKLAFFGSDIVGEGAARRKIQKMSGTISRSRNIPGEIVSVAYGDADRNGQKEVVAAYADSIIVFRVEGDDLQEKIRIENAGPGIVRVDTADVNRNGTAEIIAVRFAAGKAYSDLWEFDGNAYHRVVRDIPYFLRIADMDKEGVVLFGQESDSVTIFKGPIFPIGISRYGFGERKENEVPLPLPPGTSIYSFTPLKKRGSMRYAVLGERDRLILLDEAGKKLWESLDAVMGTETSLDPADASHPGQGTISGGMGRFHLPNRLFAVDLQGDRDDLLIVMNNLVTSGGYFENLRLFSNSEALCFAQDGDTLQLAWRSAQTGSSARDSFIDFNTANRSLRIGIATRDKGKILGMFGEWRILWMK